MKYTGLYITKNYILNTQQHNKIVQYSIREINVFKRQRILREIYLHLKKDITVILNLPNAVVVELVVAGQSDETTPA